VFIVEPNGKRTAPPIDEEDFVKSQMIKRWW